MQGVTRLDKFQNQEIRRRTGCNRAVIDLEQSKLSIHQAYMWRKIERSGELVDNIGAHEEGNSFIL